MDRSPRMEYERLRWVLGMRFEEIDSYCRQVLAINDHERIEFARKERIKLEAEKSRILKDRATDTDFDAGTGVIIG